MHLAMNCRSEEKVMAEHTERIELLKDRLINYIKNETSSIELAMIYSAIARCYFCPLSTKCDKQRRHCADNTFAFIEKGLD